MVFICNYSDIWVVIIVAPPRSSVRSRFSFHSTRFLAVNNSLDLKPLIFDCFPLDISRALLVSSRGQLPASLCEWTVRGRRESWRPQEESRLHAFLVGLIREFHLVGSVGRDAVQAGDAVASGTAGSGGQGNFRGGFCGWCLFCFLFLGLLGEKIYRRGHEVQEAVVLACCCCAVIFLNVGGRGFSLR